MLCMILKGNLLHAALSTLTKLKPNVQEAKERYQPGNEVVLL